MTIPIFTSTPNEAAVERLAHEYSFKEQQQQSDHGFSFTYPDQDRIFRNTLRQQRAAAKLQIIALAKQLDVDPSIAIWMLPGRGKAEAIEAPPAVVLMKDKKPKKRKPLVTAEEVEPPPVMPPIILASLQQPASTTIRDERPIAPESPEEAIRRLKWQAIDIALRKRRGVA
jgi:hypothetical protein